MTIRAFPQGTPQAQINACSGTPTLVSLTAQAAGNTQGGFVFPSDLVIVNAAASGNLTLTLPDPNKYGGSLGDCFMVLNANSGQTLNVYPPTGGNINNTGANTAITVANNKTTTVYLVSYTATTSVWSSDNGA